LSTLFVSVHAVNSLSNGHIGHNDQHKKKSYAASFPNTKKVNPIPSIHPAQQPHVKYTYEYPGKRLPGRSPCYHDGVKTIICYPSYSIIGIMKSGTSSLHKYLQMHPQIKDVLPKESCSMSMEPMIVDGKLRVNITDNYVYVNKIKTVFPLISINNSIFGETCVGVAPVDVMAKLAYEKYLPHTSLKLMLLRSPLEALYSSYWYFCLPEELSGSRGWDVAAYCRDYLRPDKLLGNNLWENKNNYTFPRSPEDFHERVIHPPANSTYAIFSQPVSIRVYDLFKYVKEVFDVYERRYVMIIHTEELYSNTTTILNNITRKLNLPPFDFSQANEVTYNTYTPHDMEYNGRGSELAVPVKKQRAAHPKMLAKTFTHARPYLKDHCLLMEKLVPRTCYYWLQMNNKEDRSN
jgi:hypothetical protein